MLRRIQSSENRYFKNATDKDIDLDAFFLGRRDPIPRVLTRERQKEREIIMEALEFFFAPMDQADAEDIVGAEHWLIMQACVEGSRSERFMSNGHRNFTRYVPVSASFSEGVAVSGWTAACTS